MVLSRSILISKYSSYKELHEYVYIKYNYAINEFNIDHDTKLDFKIIFKYKRIKIDINQIKRRFK